MNLRQRLNVSIQDYNNTLESTRAQLKMLHGLDLNYDLNGVINHLIHQDESFIMLKYSILKDLREEFPISMAYDYLMMCIFQAIAGDPNSEERFWGI